MILEILRWVVFIALLLVLLPYTLIAAWGLVVGLLRQLPGRSPPAAPAPQAASAPRGEPAAVSDALNT